ncbi:MAG: dihydroorotase [Candidatus Latescibacterota bacterium]|jgi:dihydroorotase
MADAKLDLLLKGARVIDPANAVDGLFDVGVLGGKIARVEANIPSEDAAHVIDVSGLLVTPGLIDIHVHAYFTRQLGEGLFLASLNADAHFPASGVTTCVDTGTAGLEEIAHFRRTVMEKSKTRVLAYINISAPGMGAPEQDIRTFDTDGASQAAKEHADVVVGIKTAHYWTSLPFDDMHPAWESVEKTVEAGNKCDMPVMIDFWPRPPVRSYPELILKKLRPGDIHTHVYARQFPVVDDAGNVAPYMFEARERGIWFDVGHGAASFWYRNGARAIKNGFGPDSISTDLHMANIAGPVFSMQDTMSKCMAMGMTLEDVIYRSTVTPAQAIRRPELGTLSIGAEADVAVLDLEKGTFPLQDCGYTRIDAKERLVCRLTLRAGQIVYDRDARTVSKWEDAPPEYWPVTVVPQRVPRLWKD